MLNFFRHVRRERPLRAGKAGAPTSRHFDCFTRHARHVLVLAQEEATRLGRNYLGTEHLLLGLIRETDGIAGQTLAALGVELAATRQGGAHAVGPGAPPPVGNIRLIARARQVIRLAAGEARRLGHHYLGTEHLVLALVGEGNGLGPRVLRDLGVASAAVRDVVLTLLAQGCRPSS